MYHLERFDESADAYQKAVQLEPSNATFQSCLIAAQKAGKISKYSPSGLLAQVPVAYSQEAPNNILWDMYVLGWIRANDIKGLIHLLIGILIVVLLHCGQDHQHLRFHISAMKKLSNLPKGLWIVAALVVSQ